MKRLAKKELTRIKKDNDLRPSFQVFRETINNLLGHIEWLTARIEKLAPRGSRIVLRRWPGAMSRPEITSIPKQPHPKHKPDGRDPVHQSDEDGDWYFWDECWAQRIGPFNDRGEAERGLSKYVKKLNQKSCRSLPHKEGSK